LPIQDQDIFFDEPNYMISGSRVSLGEGIFAALGAAINFWYLFSGIYLTAGEQHKRQRKMLNPVFSAAHLRQMGRFSLRTSKMPRNTHPNAKYPSSLKSAKGLVV
jgi:cytochrome P450